MMRPSSICAGWCSLQGTLSAHMPDPRSPLPPPLPAPSSFLLPPQGEHHVLSNLDLTRPQAMDYYTQHVQHCTHCKAALAGTRTWAARATAAAFAAFLAAGLVAAVRAQVAAGAVTGLPGWALAALGSGPLGAVAPLVVVGLVALGVVAVCRKLEGQFYYREWTRPAF